MRTTIDRDSPVPLYHQIEHALLDLIRRHGLAAGDPVPSEPELARRFGVTRLTVRRAIERLARQGVLRAERGRGTFVVDAAAGSAVTPPVVGRLTLVLPSTTGIIHLATLAGAQAEATREGFQLLVAATEGDPRREARHVAAVGTSGETGLALWPLGGATDRAALARLTGTGVPLVFVDRFLDDDHDAVVVDDRGGAAAATTHLAALGHRRIALVLYEDVDVSSVRLRRDGYRAALGAYGLVVDPELVVRHPTLPDPGDLAPMTALARRLLAVPDPPTAAVCVNDHLAQALLVVLHREGVAVPDRFSVAGFDGLDYLATHQPLTTVRRATAEMGREAIRLLVARLRAGGQGPPRRVVLPTELVLGATTSAPTAASPPLAWAI